MWIFCVSLFRVLLMTGGRLFPDDRKVRVSSFPIKRGRSFGRGASVQINRALIIKMVIINCMIGYK